MGKSTARWIKTALFGKKSSKSSDGKIRERTGNEREVSVSARSSEVDVISVPTVISHPITIINTRDERKLEDESIETANVQNDVELPGNQDNSKGSSLQEAVTDAEKERVNRAATVVQAAFRSYLARRAFKALKGIIRLQALIRGHLVRRQAVATFCCVMGVVKLQALARGQTVRRSDIGKEINDKSNLLLQEGKTVDSNGVNVSIKLAKVSPNAFVRKLFLPSPTVMPLHLYYDPEELNSVSNWLGRWSVSRVWKPAIHPKKVPSSKTQKRHAVNGQMVEAETGRSKRSVRRVPAGNIDNNGAQATSGFERPKRNIRKASSHPADNMAQENPQSELEKVKRSLRKVHNPVVENSVPSEVDIEKPKQSLEMLSGTLVDNVVGQSINISGEKKRETTLAATSKLPDVKDAPILTVSRSPDVRKNGPISTKFKSPDIMSEPILTESMSPDEKAPPEPLELNNASELSPGYGVIVESKPFAENVIQYDNTPVTNGELNKEESISNQNNKSSKKVDALLKQERAVNGVHSSPTVPSYMAATESAKAKLRAQGSPRLSQDVTERTTTTRRHSLPSSNNGKISSESPRTQRGVNSGGKGGNKSEKSTSSSRDANAKAANAEWRR